MKLSIRHARLPSRRERGQSQFLVQRVRHLGTETVVGRDTRWRIQPVIVFGFHKDGKRLARCTIGRTGGIGQDGVRRGPQQATRQDLARFAQLKGATVGRNDDSLLDGACISSCGNVQARLRLRRARHWLAELIQVHAGDQTCQGTLCVGVVL
jgi:hypothetical protein